MKVHEIRLSKLELRDFNSSIQKEWLLTNGLGGYSSSTVLGINTRKYHGLLVAALHPPGDRNVCLAKLDEEVVAGHELYRLGSNEFHDVFYPEGFRSLEEFSVSPFPTSVYHSGPVDVEKTVFMLYGKNALVTVYRVENRGSAEATFTVFPMVSMRHFHQVLNKASSFKFNQSKTADAELQLNFESPKASLVLRSTAGAVIEKPNWVERLFYRCEALRGESSVDDCYQPGRFEAMVPAKGKAEICLAAAVGVNVEQTFEALEGTTSVADAKGLLDAETRKREAICSIAPKLNPELSMNDWLNWVLLAADSFLVQGPDSGKSIIAGYHWFEAWGRDTFVSMPGLMLVTGKFREARQVLTEFNKFCAAGLIPNFLSDLSLLPSCNTVDATMWYVNAVLQYLKYTGDFGFVKQELWESLKDIAECHIKGTAFGIHMANDCLLAHGARLTWMDAEVDRTAVTPRAGKAVEIEALWYNALRILELLADRFAEKNLADTYGLLAEKAKTNFNNKFWNMEKNILFDVLGEAGSDASVRPNQVLAASLDFSMLNEERRASVVDFVGKELMTPLGLRTLSRSDPRYRGSCSGDRRNRDQSYHNGTVWPWLTGPYVTAFIKSKGNTRSQIEYSYKTFIEPLFKKQIHESGLGTVNEIFDGDPPHAPRGCISQAWSIAEPLRAYVEDILQVRPLHEKELF